jgi:hypothetical protein
MVNMVEFLNTKEISLPDDTSILYSKIRVISDGGKILNNVKNLDRGPYLWSEEKKDKDELDIEIEEHPEHFETITRYGYHRHSSHMTFEPSLGEVIKIGHDIIRNNKIVYVNTDLCDENGKLSSNVYDCCCAKLRMHRCRTIFMFKKPPVVKKRKRKNTCGRDDDYKR